MCFLCAFSASYYGDDLSDDYNLPPCEIDALYDLYNATNGEYWTWTYGEGNPWNFSQPDPNPCYEQWMGLECFVDFDAGVYHVNSLDLEYMNLSGTLPSTIGVFKYINAFSIQYASVGGKIPPTINNWTSPAGINLCGNLFTGSIPPEICELPSLFLVAFTQNQLTGTLLECFSTFPNLVYYEVSVNQLHGPVPSSYSQIGGLQYLDISFNFLSGPLPDLPLSVTHFVPASNQFTGTLPEQYSQLSLLTFLYVGINQLSGPIPASYGNMTSMQFLSLVDNFFSDTLPASLGNLTNLLNMDLTLNHFTGSFPSSIGPQQPHLAYVAVPRNSFSGSLTSSLGQVPLLQILFFFDNLFTGSLQHIFNASLQTNLTTLDFSSNLFSGEVPTEPFQIPGLTSFAAVSNCIHGSLSPSLCNAHSLQVLALDGLSTGSACQDRFFRGHEKPFSEIHSYGLKYAAISGSLPLCLFNMTHLQTLHLSGNGIVDTLTSEDLVISPSLRDLSLSHNQFYSSIPLQVQNRSWSNLDLSYNLFYGTLMDGYPGVDENSSLSLEVNRLSGYIPSSLRDAVDITMLDGNLFGCRADRSDLPSNDPDVKVFECGSNSFNYTIYVWLGLMLVSLVSWCAVKYCAGSNVSELRSRSTVDGTSFKNDSGSVVPFSFSQLVVKSVTEWMSAFRPTDPQKISECAGITVLGEVAHRIRLIYLSVAMLVCLVLLPCYVALTHFYNTYSYEYAWLVTGVYLSGVTPTIVLLVLLSLLFLVIVWMFTGLEQKEQQASDPKTEIEKTADSTDVDSGSYQERVKYVCFVSGVGLLNTSVVIGANVAYVYIEYHYSVVVVKLTQIALAGFKLVWYSTAIRPLLKMFNRFDNKRESRAGSSLHLEVFIVLFNNLVAPFVAVAFVSSDCFYNVFSDPPVVNASYEYSICQHKSVSTLNRNETLCEVEQASSMNTSYVPPFTYSYQCSSAYITTYAPIFVFTFIIIAFVSPLAQSLTSYVVNQWSGSRESTLYRLLTSLLSPLLMPLSLLSGSESSNSSSTSGLGVKLFESDLFVVRVINALSILFTFGTVLPPLAVIGCLSLFSYSYFTQLAVGRVTYTLTTLHNSDGPFASGSSSSSGPPRLLDRLSGECSSLAGQLSDSVIIIVPFALLFYGLFLFDMLGSAVGAAAAVWVPAVVAAVPVLTGGVWWAVEAAMGRSDPLAGRKSLNQLNRSSEMNEKYGQTLLNNEM